MYKLCNEIQKGKSLVYHTSHKSGNSQLKSGTNQIAKKAS